MAGEEEGHRVRIRRILVGVDGSLRSRRALRVAARLARRLEAELQGLLVEDEDWHRMGALGSGRVIGAFTGTPRSATDREMARELRSQARRLEALVRELGRTLELRAEFRSERGRPDQVLQRAAGEADLLIVADLGRGVGGHRSLGTTAHALVSESTTPLLILPQGRGSVRRILWVGDGGEDGERAGRIAAELARGGMPVERVSATDPGRLVDRVGAAGPPPLIVAPRGIDLFRPERVARTLSVLRAPVLLV